MDTIRLPGFVGGSAEWDAANARVRAGESALDWSDVRDFDAGAAARLLRGLDLSLHGESLGLGTVPGHLEERLMALLKPTRRQRRRAPKTIASGPAQPELFMAPPASATAAPPVAASPSHAVAAPPLQTASPAGIRAELEDAVVAHLRGPVQGDEEEVPVSKTRGAIRNRYLLGVLAPRYLRLKPETDDQAGEERGEGGDEGSDDGAGAAAESWLPSSFGLTFSVDGEERTIRLGVSFGRYERTTSAALHAKCAVADERVLLVSSANLTGAALGLNMELGLLVRGGPHPRTVSGQFRSLIAAGILVPAPP